jgi:hypothetical protein
LEKNSWKLGKGVSTIEIELDYEESQDNYRITLRESSFSLPDVPPNR